MRLREASIEDLDGICALESAVFGSDAWSRELMRAELEGPHRHYVALEDVEGSVQGYGGLVVVGDDGDIQTIAVSAAQRGAGHGRRIMDALLAEAADRGARRVFLEVRADRPVARALYLSLGFEEIAVRPRYYQPDDVDAVVMRAELEEAA